MLLALPVALGVSGDTVAAPLGNGSGTVTEMVRVVPGRTLTFHSCATVPLREMLTRD